MRTLIDVIIVALLVLLIIWITKPFKDPVRDSKYLLTPGGDTVWVPDSTIYYQYQERINDTSPYKGRWVDPQ